MTARQPPALSVGCPIGFAKTARCQYYRPLRFEAVFHYLCFVTASHGGHLISHQDRSQSITHDPNTPYLSVIIPTYNEATRLPATLERVIAYLNTRPFPTELLIVDDGSTDNTLKKAEDFKQSYPQVRLIKNDHRGKAYTVRTGMLAGLGTYLLFSDADLAVPIEEFEKMLPYLENGYDVVIASREGQGARRIGEPFYRHLMGRVFNLLIRLITLGGFQDTQCGFKAFRREVAHDLFNRTQLYGDTTKLIAEAAVTGFDVELLFLAVKFGYKTKEIPVQWIYGAETKVNPFRDTWRNVKDVVTVRLYDLTGRYQ